MEDGTLLRKFELGSKCYRMMSAGGALIVLGDAAVGVMPVNGTQSHGDKNYGSSSSSSASKECKFFKSGSCRSGAQCHFAHTVAGESSSSSKGGQPLCKQISFLNLETGKLTPAFVVLNSRGLTAAASGDFLGSFYRADLTIFDVKRGTVSVMTHKFDIHSVAFHPRRPVVVLGDRRGQMHVNHSLDKGSPVTEVMHWHAFGVSSLLYAGEDGNLLLSGGTEDCVVVWQLETRKKMFVPHLGSLGVFNLAVSGNGRVLACVCADNSLFVIQSSDLRVSRRILGMRTMAPNLIKSRTAMLVSPGDSRCLVFSGKANTLQWYNVEQDACAFELPVLRAAVVPRGGAGRKQMLDAPPSRVEHAAFGSYFLATLDARSTEDDTVLERNLKFWRPSASQSGAYELACLVLRPHSKRITCLAANSVRDEFCTLGKDGSWKIWRLSVNQLGETSAVCSQSQEFKGLKPKCCTFSADGSLLAVMYYGSILTLWNPLHGTLLKVVATQGPYLNTVAIHSCPDSSLIVGMVPGEYVWVFDLISCRIRYRLRVDVADLAVHWRQSYFSIVTFSGRVLLLDALSPQPLWCHSTTNALRVQFVEMSDGRAHVAVLGRAGSIELFEANELSSIQTDDLAEMTTAQSRAGGVNRFDGILGVASLNGRSQTTGRNNVAFASTFLSDSASHVLPANTLMLSSLMTELLRVHQQDLSVSGVSNSLADQSDLGTMLMDLDHDDAGPGASLDTLSTKLPVEKLPHHFSNEERSALAAFFSQKN